LGESEETIRRLFQVARRFAPCIIFFDEIEAVGSKRGIFSKIVFSIRVLYFFYLLNHWRAHFIYLFF